MSDTDRIITDEAPRNKNPYSQGVHAGDTLYVSGYGPVDPETGDDIEGDIRTQTERVLDNIAAVVDEAGGDGLDDVVKTTVYLTDLDDYDAVNDAYGARVPGTPPARVCVEVARLPGDVRVEMDAIAYLG
ncbi:endoribonuclease L-PSP, putative [Haladaptatus paucihalophilus DX253]|uniref:2-iminobutanoate/2-iminopropanoate deaminase n=1 Tax=Haladaptatus paucihalophilus DX253 TaxID=797209 RepID=E7QVH4_HALPU|nr:Rid family detoxifying hydrolase [Haladaptatus paucihalophilus]EFW91496.1 endoribonuclease L-PSP, putative [Haladaptatus paucihalophilus DX253]SHL30921.1 2-iminobutanoate/2-iminopropanoate deaminase [Haladaptatus paucihalophilus DX253]